MRKSLLSLFVLSTLALSGCDALNLLKKDSNPDDKGGETQERSVEDIESISIDGDLINYEYVVGETWDTTGLKVEATYNDKTVEELDSSKYEFIFDEEEPVLAMQELEIFAHVLGTEIYSESVIFDVIVRMPEISSISLEGDLKYFEYTEGDDWDTEGLYVEGTYADGEIKELHPSLYEFIFSEPVPVRGMQELTISAHLKYSDIYSQELIFDVIVYGQKTLTKIEIDGNLEKTSYYVNDNWDLSSLSVKGFYDDGTKQTLPSQDYTFTCNPSKAVIGTTSVSIFATHKSTGKNSATVTYNVTVAEPTVTYIVSFSANGGSGSMPSIEVHESSFKAPQCDFTYYDHTFKEWDLNGVKYQVGDTISISSNITLVATWTENSGSDYYAKCDGLTGSALQAKLKEINPPVSPSYDWSRYEDADEALDDPTCILSIYTRHNIKKSNHCGSYAWDKWNREHVWTQSSYPASKTDNHNIFACEGQINGYRSDKPFAEGGEVVVVFGHTTGCKQTSNTFEPCDEAKGEIARSVMYGTVQYSYTMTQEIDSIALALKWHLQHPITNRDIIRNDIVYGNQGNRNPFVDHPEYACKIWGNTNSETKALCGIH